MPTELPSAAVADAGPLIHLDELGLLTVLDGFRHVWVPAIVAAEAERHRPAWRARAPACVSIEDVPRDRIDAILRDAQIDAGEAAALALWGQHREAILLCDDLAARKHAESIGCGVAGTLGLVLWAARVGRLDLARAKDALRSVPHRTTLHIRGDVLARVVDSLDDA